MSALPVAELAADDCVLFLWTTWPEMQEALELIPAWGFTYQSIAFVWVKLNRDDAPFLGLGRWTRGNTEPCPLATRGGPQRISPFVSQLVFAEKGRHSEKPGEVRERIVELVGDIPRIELFARKSVPGWASWGDELEESA